MSEHAAFLVLAFSTLLLALAVVGQGLVTHRILKREAQRPRDLATAIKLGLDGALILESLKKIKRERGDDGGGALV